MDTNSKVAKAHYLLGTVALKLQKQEKASANFERALQYYSGLKFKTVKDKNFVRTRELSEELLKLTIEREDHHHAVDVARRY